MTSADGLLPAWDPRAVSAGGAWAEEAREEALARAPEFGRRFFVELAARFPAAGASVRFMRWSAQPRDVYAVAASPDGGFVVQVDPDLEYLVVWSAAERAEFGDWDGDQTEPALALVAELLASTG
jgi:hypothetical protein